MTIRLRAFLDPDRTWSSPDKLAHLIGFAAVMMVYQLAMPWPLALLALFGTAVAFEFGQWDTARGVPAMHDADGNLLAGYGFGLIDLAFSVAGAVAVVLIKALLAA